MQSLKLKTQNFGINYLKYISFTLCALSFALLMIGCGGSTQEAVTTTTAASTTTTTTTSGIGTTTTAAQATTTTAASATTTTASEAGTTTTAAATSTTTTTATTTTTTTTIAVGEIAFVSEGNSQWANWDIYLRNMQTGATSRLTTNPAIDNHPDLSPANNWIVFSSNRGSAGEFDIYLADKTSVEGTIEQLTNDSYPNGSQTSYPDRHPHFHPNGQIIVFTSKNRPVVSTVEVASECSVPKIITSTRYYEGLNIISLEASGSVETYKALDIRDTWDQTNFPNIWVNSLSTYVGHPSFNHDGTKIVFTGSIDGSGTTWEVYTVDIEIVSLNLVSNSLRRITNGPSVGANPIQMSGGAHFNHDDSKILFSSTRTTNGNSQLFSVPASSTDIPITSATQLTSHAGNDYVPEPLDDGRIMMTSDLGSPAMSAFNGGLEGPTTDLDIFIMNPDGSDRTNLTNNNGPNDTSLIADEVSWFCGLPPNLSAATFMPRTMSVENIWIGKTAWLNKEYPDSYPPTLIPSNLLAKFNYPDQAVDMYALGWENMHNYLTNEADTSYVDSIINDLMSMISYSFLFPGLGDEASLEAWLAQTSDLRNKKYVVPSIMYDKGIGKPYP